MIRRREFVSSVLAAGAALPVLARGAPVLANRALPTANQLHWADLEVGLFLHFAPNTWQSKEYDDRSTPLTTLNPDIDTDQWAAVARDLGARYVVMVAKHVGGFCMWQTETTEYSIRNTPWKGGHGDVLADVSASCRKYGLGLGVYCSPRDDNFGSGGGGRCDTPEKQAAYNAIYRRQLTELLTRYGEMVEIWFDGSIVVPVCDIVRMHAP
ncbi:MAG TPA: alpha-L-fucosidase, partial [Gemmatimonadales bacterium]|nr:alpha-L-fucosidase [Gemmatimonadales bacterium]